MHQNFWPQTFDLYTLLNWIAALYIIELDSSLYDRAFFNRIKLVLDFNIYQQYLNCYQFLNINI